MVETVPADNTSDAGCLASGIDSCEDGLGSTRCSDDCQLMSTAASSVESVNMKAHEVDSYDERRLNDSESVAAAAADCDVYQSGRVDGCVDVPADDVANNKAECNADVRDEPPIAGVMNEPQQPADDAAAAAAVDDAHIAEPVGNIIPPPIALLAPQGLGDVHQAMMQGGGPVGFQPYKRPNVFAFRVMT